MRHRVLATSTILAVAGCFSPGPGSSGVDTLGAVTEGSVGSMDGSHEASGGAPSSGGSDPDDGAPTTGPSSSDASETQGTESSGDTEPPQFESFTVNGSATPSPIEQAEYVDLATEVTDNVEVASVEFYDDGTLIGTDDDPPWEVSWLVNTAVLSGSSMLTARAYDAAGNEAESPPVDLVIDLPIAGTRMWSTPFEPNSTVWGVAVDSQDNVVATGIILVGGFHDLLLKKLGPDGGQLWSSPYDHDGNSDFGLDVVITDDDEIIVGGEAKANCPGSYIDCATISLTQRYDAGGGLLWTATDVLEPSGSADWAQVRDIAYDPATGEVAVLGYLTESPGGEDVYLRRWTGSGDPVWVETSDISGNDLPNGVAFLAEGSLAVVGRTQSSSTNYDWFVQRWSGSGSVVDTEVVDCSGGGDRSDSARAVAADPDGGLYVVGSDCDDSPWARKYAPDGSLIWTLDQSDLGPIGSFNGINSVAVAPDGSSIAMVSVAGASYSDAWVSRRSPDGDELFTTTYANPQAGEDAFFGAVAVDELGYVYVGGFLDASSGSFVQKYHP